VTKQNSNSKRITVILSRDSVDVLDKLREQTANPLFGKPTRSDLIRCLISRLQDEPSWLLGGIGIQSGFDDKGRVSDD